MSFMKDATEITLQAKLFDFALAELVFKHRESFQPLWTCDSWAKFLIWLALNCGLSGEKESLELFAEALGAPLTSRMRRLFFERTLEDLGLKVMADPSEKEALVLSMGGESSIDDGLVMKALDQVGLLDRIVAESTQWQTFDAVVAIPWQDSEIDC